MALNKKIVSKIKETAAEDDFLKKNMILLLTRVDDGKQPKREIEKILKDIK